MAILVVGGSGRGVGKTALVCGLIAALPEFRWTGVKITTDDHGMGEPIWDETDPGQGSDTARYLSAGAVRALLVTAPMSDFSNLLFELWAKLGPGTNVIFESNRILEHIKPELCLVVVGGADEAVLEPEAPEISGICDESSGERSARAKARVNPAASMRGLKPPPPSESAFATESQSGSKSSFSLAARCADAVVVRAGGDRMLGEGWGSKPIFQLAEMEHVSPEMLAWIRPALLRS